MNNEHPNTNPETPQDAALRQLLQTHLPVESPSLALQERITRMATQTPASTVAPVQSSGFHRARTWRLALSAAMFVLLIAVGAVVWPRMLAKQAIARVEAALARVSTMHCERYRIEGKKLIKESDLWFDNGKWRAESKEQGYTTLYVNGTSWFYDASKNIATVQKNSKGPFHRNPSGFTLANLTQDLGNPDSKTTMTLQGTTTLNGRTMKRALIENDDDYEDSKILLLVNPETDLPSSADLRVRTRYGKEGHWQMTFSYNRRLSPKLFKPFFGRSTRFVTSQAPDPRLSDKHLVRGLARKRVGNRTIAIRALEVNPHGSVFVFYTAGKRLSDAFTDNQNYFAGRDWKAFLSDSLGNRYQWMRGDGIESGGLNLHTVEGDRLEGDWWVPLQAPKPGQKWQPRTFTLKFKLNPANLHGGGGVKFLPDYSQVVKFSVPVSETTTSVLPPIIKTLGLQLSEEELEKSELETRGELPPGVQPSKELVRELDADGVFSPDSTQLAQGVAGGMRLVRLSDGVVTHFLKAPPAFTAFPQNTVFSPDGQSLFARFAVDRNENNGWLVCLWDVRTGTLRASWHWDAIRDVSLRDLQFAPDGKTLHALNTLITQRGGDGTRQWVEQSNAQIEERDVLTGHTLSQHILPHDGFVLSASQFPTPWLAVTGQTNSKTNPSGVIRVWDAHSGSLLRTLPMPSYYTSTRLAMGTKNDLIAVICQERSKDGGMLSGLNQIRLYAGQQGQFLRAVTPQVENYLDAMALSPDGRWLAAENGNHTIGIWDAQTGNLEHSLIGHYAKIYQFHFSPDSRMLVTTDISEKKLLWRLP